MKLENNKIMKEENKSIEKNNKFPTLIKIAVIILCLIGGIFGFFGSFRGEMFLSSSVDWQSVFGMILSVLSPFWVGGILLTIMLIFSAITKKKINKIKAYLYSTFIYAGMVSFNALAEITDYSRQSFLVIGFVVAFIWFSERKIKNIKRNKAK